jgi:hypothetical protein
MLFMWIEMLNVNDRTMTRMESAVMRFLKAVTGYRMRINNVKGRNKKNTQATVTTYRK